MNIVVQFWLVVAGLALALTGVWRAFGPDYVLIVVGAGIVWLFRIREPKR